MRNGLPLLAGIVALSPLGVWAAGADLKGDAMAGRTYARANCVECHAVEDRSAPPVSKTGAPSFQAIADAKTTTAAGLYVFLVSQHQSMPQFMIGEDDRQNIVAYIISLRSRGKS